MSKDKMKQYGIENIDGYEREKIERTIQDLERAASTLRTYLTFADQLQEQGVAIAKKEEDFSNLRHPGGNAGPKSDINEILGRAERASFQAQNVAEQNGLSLKELQEENVKRTTKRKVKAILSGSFEDIKKSAAQESVK